MPCPHSSDEAQRIWSKACNFHRRTDLNHECGNPYACARRIREAEMVEKVWSSFQDEMC